MLYYRPLPITLLFQMFLPTLPIEYSEVYSALQSRGKLLLNLLTHESDLLLCIRHQVNNKKIRHHQNIVFFFSMYICIWKSEKFLFPFVFNYLFVLIPPNLEEVREIKWEKEISTRVDVRSAKAEVSHSKLLRNSLIHSLNA